MLVTKRCLKCANIPNCKVSEHFVRSADFVWNSCLYGCCWCYSGCYWQMENERVWPDWNAGWVILCVCSFLWLLTEVGCDVDCGCWDETSESWRNGFSVRIWLANQEIMRPLDGYVSAWSFIQCFYTVFFVWQYSIQCVNNPLYLSQSFLWTLPYLE